ncbi:MAG: hypothetical protein K2X66_00290 [Cyanobacteria bacterium]|nr:hypothetical protein [Cyanobacteriota bacterium]
MLSPLQSQTQPKIQMALSSTKTLANRPAVLFGHEGHDHDHPAPVEKPAGNWFSRKIGGLVTWVKELVVGLWNDLMRLIKGPDNHDHGHAHAKDDHSGHAHPHPHPDKAEDKSTPPPKKPHVHGPGCNHGHEDHPSEAPTPKKVGGTVSLDILGQDKKEPKPMTCTVPPKPGEHDCCGGGCGHEDHQH